MLRKFIPYKGLLLIICCFLLYGCKEKSTNNPKRSNKKEVKKDIQSDSNYYVEKYNDGQIKIKGQYKNGLRDSLWTSYYPNGIKQSENYYSDSLLHGNSVTYYKNGNVRYTGFYLEGKQHGKWVIRGVNGIKKVIWYKNGIKQ